MIELSVVGKSVIRVDALEKATGQAMYASDIKLPRMLYAKVLGSPYPHARIVSIDTSKAEQYPGVVGVVTGKDAPKEKYGAFIRDQNVLAQDTVRAIGEPVAALAAESIDAAAEALKLIEVKYEPLPAIFDAEEAMSTNPPVIIHPDLFSYEWAAPWLRRLDSDRPNVFMHFKIRKGDVDDGFQQSDLVIENRFTTPRIQHSEIEPYTTVVQPEADGGLTMWICKHGLQIKRAELSHIFNIKPTRVRIIQPYIGGCFGRGVFHDEPIVVLLALKTGRPVKLVLTREELFYRGGTREQMIIYIKDGVKSDGTIVARQMKAILVGGGSGECTMALVTRISSFSVIGRYRTPNLKWDSYGVYLNEPVTTALRGFGNAETTWAIESHMDMMAEKLGISPVEIRRINILREGEANVIGEITHSIGAEQCLDRMAEFIRLDEKPEGEGVWRRGKGISLCSKHTLAPSASMARVKVMEDGSIVVYHGAEEAGQGCDTVMAQIAAEEFGISVDEVKIAFSDSLYIPYDGGSISSRSTYHAGNAIRLASIDAKRQLFERAATRLGVSPDELETRTGSIYVKGVQDKEVKIVELFGGYKPGEYGSYTTGGEIVGSATFAQESASEDHETGQIDPKLAAEGKRLNAYYSHMAKAVEVAVNTETGEVKVLRYGSADDMGQPINPKMCEQQVEGGMVMGIGAALYEEVILKEGKVANPNLTDYRIPSMGEMPTIDNVKSVIAAVPHKDGPYGAKGLGEGVLMGIDAAIANAVYNAVGIRIKDLPITAEKVLNALRELEVKE